MDGREKPQTHRLGIFTAAGIVAGPLLLAVPAAGSAQCRSTPRIDTLIIANADVAEGGFATVLHIRTRPGVIRRTVLLHVGDCYDSARVAESERALWSLGVFRAVDVDTVRLEPGGPLALRIVTADGWSARPVADYSRTGPSVSWELGVREANVLGTASQLFAAYRSTPDRRLLALQYYRPHVLVPGGILWISHSQMSNGRQTNWLVGLPFREAAARRSITLGGDAGEEHYLSFALRGGPPGPRGRALRFRFTAAVAPHATPRDFVRLWVAARWRHEEFSPADSVPYAGDRFASAGAGVELGRARYRPIRRFNTYGRREWVDLSHTVRLGVWAAPRAWGYPADRAGLGAELGSRSGASWHAGHAALSLDATGGWVRGVLDSGQVRARVTMVQQVGHHTFLAHGDVAGYVGARPWGMFDLWLEQRGPRLLPPHTFQGQRVRWLLLEDRYRLSESVAGLLGVGIAPFVEYGESRYVGAPLVRGGDVGMALRLAPLRMAASDVTELAVGYRLWNTGGRPGWALGLRKGLTL